MVIQKNKLIYLFFPVPFLFYWYTCLPSIGLGDSVLFLHAIKQLKLSTWVNNHNFTAIVGWGFQFLPFGDIAYRGNLSCVFTSALAVCIFYMAIYRLHRCLATALVSASFVMISHSFWWHATDLADYSMNCLFAAIFIYLYVQWHISQKTKYLYAIFFTCGLAIFQHYLLGTFLIGAIVALLLKLWQDKKSPWEVIKNSSIFFFIGVLPWILLFIHDVSISHSFTKTLSGCFGGPFKNLFFKQPLWNGIKEYLTLVYIQFPSLYIIPVALGLLFNFRAWKFTPVFIGVLFSYLPNVYFDLGLNSWAVFAQLLPTHVILGFWASFVVHWIVRHPRLQTNLTRYLLIGMTLFSLCFTIYFYANLSKWGEDPKNIWYPRYNNSYTYNSYRLNEFLANPNKRDYRDIENFCLLALEKLPQHAQFWDSDSRLFFQFKEYYQQYYRKRLDLDVQLINSFGYDNWGNDKDSFVKHIKNAYANNKDFFLCALSHPFAAHLNNMPDNKKYEFKKFHLNDKLWVYKLVTANETNPSANTLWRRWDIIPTDKSTLINLSLDNVVDFHEGTIILQDDINSFGPFWMNEDQVFFAPSKQGNEIGFMLNFASPLKANLTLKLTTAFDAGIVEIWLNNKIISKEPIDLYTVGVNNHDYLLENASFDKGNNILSIRVIGKNDKSSDMKLGVDTLKIEPVL